MAQFGLCLSLLLVAILVETTSSEDPVNPFLPPKKSVLEAYDILSNVINNYAITVVSAQYVNRGVQEEEVQFKYRLPYNAYISNMTITYSNPEAFYKAVVKDKINEENMEDPLFKIYGGPVHAENFSISVPLQHNRHVLFTLIYEHPVSYRKGIYEYNIDLSPGQPTERFNLKIKIKNNRKIIHAEATQTQLVGPDNEEKKEQFVDLDNVLENNHRSITLVHNPSRWEQTRESEAGLNGEFSVRYDVERENDTRYLMVGDNHFSYFFAPEYNPSPPRHFVFLVDTSKSSRPAVDHIKETIITLIGDLKPFEAFSVITYGSNIKIWNGVEYVAPRRICNSFTKSSREVNSSNETCLNGSILVNNDSIKSFSDHPLIISSPWSDLSKGFGAALNHVEYIAKKRERIPLLILISNWLEADLGFQQSILSQIRENSLYDVPIFTLGFGTPKLHTFLSKISKENYGFAENMFSIVRSRKALQDFLRWTKPTSSTIQVVFRKNVIHDSVSQSLFHSSLQGSEHVVCGKTMNEGSEIDILLTTFAKVNQFPDTRNWNKLQKEQRSIDEQYNYFLRRMWAHSKLKALVKQIQRATNLAEVQRLQKKGIDLSLQTNFASEFAPMFMVEADINKDVGHFPLILLQQFRHAKQIVNQGNPPFVYVPVQIQLSMEEHHGMNFHSCSIFYPDEVDVSALFKSGSTIVTKPGGYPWVVSVKTKGGQQCSGTIVADNWVLTAADCVVSLVPDQMCVVAGEHNFQLGEKKHQLVAADKILFHEHPLSDSIGTPYDVALIRLNKKLKYNDDVKRILFPPEGLISNGDAKVSIWKPRESNGLGDFVEMSLRIVDDEDCRTIFKVDDIILPDSYMCAEDVYAHEESVCSIVPGSPLLCTSANHTYVCAIAAWSPTKKCEPNEYPTLFTEASYLVSWIEESIQTNDES